MSTSTVNRLVLGSRRIPPHLTPNSTYTFVLPGKVDFPTKEIPLVPGDENGRALGTTALATVEVRNVSYDEGTNTTTGEYVVQGRYALAGSCAPLGRYPHPPSPRHR